MHVFLMYFRELSDRNDMTDINGSVSISIYSMDSCKLQPFLMDFTVMNRITLGSSRIHQTAFFRQSDPNCVLRSFRTEFSLITTSPYCYTEKKIGFLRNLKWFFTWIHSRNLLWFCENWDIVRN